MIAYIQDWTTKMYNILECFGIKKLASRLPSLWQQELKRLYYRCQIHRQTFETTEPEFLILDQLISAGDWVIDIGANVGHYTKRFSDLVGPQGRVIAVEPVPDTFALLAANVLLFQYRNVTLLNLAASDQTTVDGCAGFACAHSSHRTDKDRRRGP
jgi:predicted methyltransferase